MGGTTSRPDHPSNSRGPQSDAWICHCSEKTRRQQPCLQSQGKIQPHGSRKESDGLDWDGTPGVSRSVFPNSAALGIAYIDKDLDLLRIQRSKVLQDLRGRKVRAARLQSAFYDNILHNWKWWDRHSLMEAQSKSLEALVRSRGVAHLQLPPQRARILTTRFVQNFRHVARTLPPRAAAVLIRSGLHGWFTKHRFGAGGDCCFLCNRYVDSLDHISRCSVTRKVWAAVMGTVSFDPHALLGFLESDKNDE